MDRKELLTKVRDEAGLHNLKQADNAVRVIVGLLKAMLPEDLALKVERSLPDDLRQGWRIVEPYPADILEREDMYFEGTAGGEATQSPTITHG